MNSSAVVSIIICTHNRAGDLRRTLASLARLCVPEGLPVELIVVDNASADDTKQVVKSCTLEAIPVRYVYEARRGLSHARNAGLAAARGDILLFTDDDVRPSANWIIGMSEPILRGRSDAVAGGVRLAPHLLRDWMKPPHRGWLASTENGDDSKPVFGTEGVTLVGANMAFSRKVFVAVPEFDTELGAGALGFAEETLFSSQIEQAGFTIGEANDACVEHHCSVDRLLRASYADSARKLGRSMAYINHHWHHGTVHHVRPRLIKHRLRLAYRRYATRQEWQADEGMAPWEMSLLLQLHFFGQTLIERRRPRNYAKNGCRKLNGDTARCV